MILDLWDWDIHFEDYLTDDWLFEAAFGEPDTLDWCAQNLKDCFLEKTVEFWMDYNQHEDPVEFENLVKDGASEFIRNWRESLTKGIATNSEEPDLLKSLLRTELKTASERNCDDYMYELLKSDFFNPIWGAPNYNRKHLKNLERIWDFSRMLLEILLLHSKKNGFPKYEDWCGAIPCREFTKFLNDLFYVPRGRLGILSCLDTAMDWIDNIYTDYDAYHNVKFAIRFIELHTTWIAEKFPSSQSTLCPGLFRLCADLTKYCINLPNEPMIGPPGGIYDILKWSPELSLKYLCKSHNEGVVDDYIFEEDGLLDTVYELSEMFPGELKDQLLGIYHTNLDEGVQKGALALIETFEL